MTVLAIDTTTRTGSAAVVRNGVVLGELCGDPAVTHGQRLPGDLVRLVAEAGVSLDEVDLLAVAAGPGSFTGLRVGIAAMQGLAMATGKPVVPVSTLEALARRVTAPAGGLVAAWVDAQRGEVFAALYEHGGEAPLAAPTALPPGPTLLALDAMAGVRQVRFTGDGAVRYADLIEAAFEGRAEVDREAPRLAVSIALIAEGAPGRAVAPHAVAPIYIRRPDAELARERRRDAIPPS
jgi:tRNA threonylcarbamoyladenosine biosynthesis protein TsaB